MSETKMSQAELDAKEKAAEQRGYEKLQAEIKAKEDRQTELDEYAAKAVKAEQDKQEAEKKIADEKAEADKKLEDEKNIKNRRLPDGTVLAPEVAKYAYSYKYDNLDPGAHAFMMGVQEAGGKQRPSEDSLKALAIKCVEEKDTEGELVPTKMAMKMAGMPLKANELNQSTLAGYGDEWVGVTYSSNLWERIRLGTEILAKLPTIEVPQGSESVIIPLQAAAPTFYKVAQASAQDSNPGPITHKVTTSRMATDNQTLTVSKLGAGTDYTGELVEDSLIPWATELRDSIVIEGMEVLESIVIDGDTATGATTNINDIGGTPAGTEAFLLFNGFRKLALVTNTANSRDAGAFTSKDFLETVKLMGIAGKNAVQKDKVFFLLDLWAHWASLELSDVKTRDVFSPATIENGLLTGIWGYNVFTSANMHRANQDTTYGLKANSAGKTDLDTAANNTKGAMLAVRPDQWRFGYKRRMTIEVDRVPRADASEITALMRVGMIYRDTDASAISYNLTV